MSDEVRELRARMKDFIDNVGDQGRARARAPGRARLPPGHRAAARALRGGRGPGPRHVARRARPGRRRRPGASTGPMADLKAEAKARGLWALGHPAEIGGGGLPFMDFVYLNEIIGRSEYGQVAVGIGDDAGLDHAPPLRQRRAARALPRAAGGRRAVYPSVGLTEPEVAGSDPTQMQTTAYLDGDEWVINGHKWFTSGRLARRVHDRVRQDRARRREAHAVQLDHRARPTRPAT